MVNPAMLDLGEFGLYRVQDPELRSEPPILTTTTPLNEGKPKTLPISQNSKQTPPASCSQKEAGPVMAAYYCHNLPMAPTASDSEELRSEQGFPFVLSYFIHLGDYKNSYFYFPYPTFPFSCPERNRDNFALGSPRPNHLRPLFSPYQHRSFRDSLSPSKRSRRKSRVH